MIKYLTITLILLTAATSHAQNTRTDTILLSVYNTGSKFRVYPANFGNTTRGATMGNVEIPTVDYPNGTYFVTLQYGKEVKTEKLVVRH